MSGEVYTSFESAVYKTADKTFSITPKPVPTDKRNPYKLLDQNGSKVRFMINDHSGTAKNWAQANISVPEMDTLLNVVNQACAGMIKDWSMPQQVKIFGDKDEKGYMIVSKFAVSRTSLGKDGQPKKFPWYIAIEKGKGIGLEGKAKGSVYMKSGSYVQETAVYINLTDEDFKGMLFWTSKLFDVFLQATKHTVIDGYAEFSKASKAKAKTYK